MLTKGCPLSTQSGHDLNTPTQAALMEKLEELFSEIEARHQFVLCSDGARVDDFAPELPSDLRSFYKRFEMVDLFVGEFGPLYQVLPLSDHIRARVAVLQNDSEEAGPSSWYALCDVQDGNYIAVDLESEQQGGFNYIDCFHETFALPGESRIIARSFTELLKRMLQGGSEQLFFLQPGFEPYGDAF
jgi:hypothetical protein